MVEIVGAIENNEFCANGHRVRGTHNGKFKSYRNRHHDRRSMAEMSQAEIRDTFRETLANRVPYYGEYMVEADGQWDLTNDYIDRPPVPAADDDRYFWRGPIVTTTVTNPLARQMPSMSDDHHADDAEIIAFGVLTVSSSRTLEADESGDTLVSEIEAAGHTVAARDLVADSEDEIRECVEDLVAHADVEAVVTSGGTGLTPDDVTVDAVAPLFDREIPGFGEQFRAKSVEEVGPHGMLTRAKAGIAQDVPVFCLPGSEQAATFGMTELVEPVVGHVVGLVSGGGHHHDSNEGTHDDHHDHGGDE